MSIVGLGLWTLALAVFTALVFDGDDGGLGGVAVAALLAGPPLGGILIGAATIGRFHLALGAVVLLMFSLGALALVIRRENGEAVLFLLFITLPSAALGVVLGHLGAWLVRRITTV